jgi:NAD(P)-dependent dehydrogenase (short-subunit alcohol dehydrogenase family)
MTNRIVLVTGASTGLGRAMALDLTARGHTVYGTSRGAMPDAGFAMLPLDVRDAGSAAATVQRIVEKEGRIDVLINNAGYAFVGAFEETGVEDARAQFETNVFGAMRMMKAVLPHMRSNGFGRIVNISSASGLVGTPFLSAYAASKHALEALSESLSFELRGTAIA